MRETSFRKKYQELAKTLQAYQSAVNEAAIVSITDQNGRILYVNDTFVRVSKYSSAELIGNNHRIINSGYHSPEFFKQMWQTISRGHHWRGQIKNRAKDGSYYWVDTVITPVIDKNNKIFQYLSVRNLITAQKENEEKLIHFQQELLTREQQLKEAQQIAKTGSWHLNVPGNTLEWSEETYRIFGIAPGTAMNYGLFLEKVHPDDRHMVNTAWQSAIKGAPYEIEHRIVTPDGIKWVSERASLIFDASLNFAGGTGTVQDITEKKKTDDILRESETLYKNLFNNSPSPIGILKKDTLQFLEVNETATRLYGYSREEFLQKTAYDIRISEDDHFKLKEQLEKGEYAWDSSIRRHCKKNGEILLVEPSITEIIYKGQPAFLITINDVTEKRRMQEQLIKAKISRQVEITRASMEAQEKSRAEIGRELHDNINQLLVASNLYLKNVKLPPGRESELIDKSVEIISTAIQEIRKLSWAFVPPSLRDHTFKESLEALTWSFKLTNTAVDFDIRIHENSIEDNMKINIYRIVQEQINNIIKYAEAKKVKIRMWQQENLLTLEIQDNGKGFDQLQKSKGIGITNIIHRAEAYNGKVSIETRPGQGCRLYIEFTQQPENMKAHIHQPYRF